MLGEYLPILVFLAVGFALAVILLGLGLLAAPRRPDVEKDSPFECGFPAFEDSRYEV